MKRHNATFAYSVCTALCTLVVSVPIASSAVSVDAKVASPDQASVKILLVGNSFLRWNNLPDRIRTYFAENFPGTNVTIVSNIVDGRTIQAALDATAPQTLLSSCDWNAAIVQGRNGLTWRLDGQTKWMPPESFIATTKQLKSTVSGCAGRVALFAPWSFQSARDHLLEDYTYSLASQTTGIAQLPMGRIFARLRDAGLTGIVDVDGSHPGKLGSDAIAAAISEFAARNATPSASNSSADSGAALTVQRRIVLKALDEVATTATNQPLSTPAWDEFPKLPKAEDTIERAAGSDWFAKNGATRGSYGTMMRFRENTIEATEFNVAGRTVRRASGESVSAQALRFTLRSLAVDFDFQVSRQGSALKALSRSGPKDRLNYQTATYVPANDDPYYAGLKRLYDRFDSEVAEKGLAATLPSHVARVNAYLATHSVSPIEFDEWELILLAWHFSEQDNKTMASKYLDAASAMFPNSQDVKRERTKLGLDARAN